MSDKINVMVVEDQTMPRQLFETIVKSDEKLNLAVSIDNAEIADICCVRHGVDLVLMDVVTKDGASGLVAAEKIKEANKVEGFWYKDFSKEPILSLVHRVLDGEIVYPEDMPKVALGLADSSEFTEREFEVLREVTGGFTNAEIAEKFGISEKRVRNLVAGMLDKTGFRSRTELAVRAREAGIVILERQEDDI